MTDADISNEDGGLFSEHRAELPEEWHDTFDELIAQGKAPTSIKATIEYVTSKKTQAEVSREMNVSDMTIRNLQAAVVALGPIDSKQASTHGAGQMTAMDICNHVADRLGWDESVEYTVSENAYNSSAQPSIRKEGWRSIYEALVQEQDDAGGA